MSPKTQRARPVPPPPHHTVTPRLVVADSRRAIAFYKEAFGATELMTLDDPQIGGKVVHAEVVIGDSVVSLTDENPDHGARGPNTLGGTPVVLTLNVEDVDAVAARAIAAGAKVIFPVKDQFYGMRQGRVQDPFGHQWVLSTRLEELTEQEMRHRMAEWWKTPK